MATSRQHHEHSPETIEQSAVYKIQEIDGLLADEAKELDLDQAEVDSMIQRNPSLGETPAVAFQLGKLKGRREILAALIAQRTIQNEA